MLQAVDSMQVGIVKAQLALVQHTVPAKESLCTGKECGFTPTGSISASLMCPGLTGLTKIEF